MASLKEKLAAKKAAEAAAAGKKAAPAAPRAAPLSEPPQRESSDEVTVEREPAPSPAPAPQAPLEAPKKVSEPAAAPVPVAAPASPAKVVFPKVLKPARPSVAEAEPPTVAAKPAKAPGQVDAERESTPAMEVDDAEIVASSSGGMALPSSLAGESLGIPGVDLSLLDEPAEKKEEPKDSSPPPAPARKSEPPKAAPRPAPDSKVQKRQRNIYEGGEVPLSQGFSIKHVEADGAAADRFVLKGHGVEKEVVLRRKKAESLKIEAEDGEFSVSILYLERNDEGAMVLHSEIEGESNLDKAREKTAKAVKKAGSAVSNLRHYVPEMISAAFVPLWSGVLVSLDWFSQFSQAHSNMPRNGVAALVVVQIALTVWSALSRKNKLANSKEA